MATQLKLAALGHTMERGRVLQWHVIEGAVVERGTVLVEIETDKSVVDVESPASGILLRIDAPSDQEYPVGTTLAWIGEKGEGLPARTEGSALGAPSLTDENRVTPVARRLAERHGIDADQIPGTGPGGKVTKEDVKKAIESGSASTLTARDGSDEPAHDVHVLEGIRRVTADRLSAHWTATPQVSEGVEIDMTELRATRRANRDAWRARYPVMPSLNDLILRAVVLALKDHPVLNAALVGEEVHRYHSVNLGVAIDIEQGLVVPVVRGADKMDLGSLAAAVSELSVRAERRKLLPDDFEGGTFTISNLSALGVDWFTPVLNPPQVALLGVGRMRRAPAVAGNEIVTRDLATFVLTFDHRVIDGAPAGRFLATLRRMLESPRSWLSD